MVLHFAFKILFPICPCYFRLSFSEFVECVLNEVRNGTVDQMKAKGSDVGPLPSPERAVYGFALFVLTIAFFVVYVIWAFVPHEFLHSVGLSYWPAEHWAVTGPLAVIILTCLSVFVLYPWLSVRQCANRENEMSLITDSFAVTHSDLKQDEIDLNPVFDYDISKVNKLLYTL